jgi:hypothetical protein
MVTRVPRRDVLSRLRQLLVSQFPFGYCDACLALWLDVNPADANAAALTVGREPSFTRQRRDCYGCGRSIQLTSMTRGTGPASDR